MTEPVTERLKGQGKNDIYLKYNETEARLLHSMLEELVELKDLAIMVEL